MIRYTRILMSLALILLSSACEEKERKITLDIHSTDDRNQAIAQAEIRLNNQVIAETDDNGNAKLELTLPTFQRNSLELRKESPETYYAPFFYSFFIDKKTKPTLNIKAILYSVPKASENVAQEQTEPVFDEATVEQVDPIVEETTDSAEQIQITELSDDTTEAKVEDENELPKDNEQVLGIAQTLPTVDEEMPASSLEELSIEKEEKTPINFYSFQTNKPIENVEILFADKSTKEFVSLCKTGKRGRCQVELDRDILDQKTVFLARKAGFITQKNSLTLSKQNKVRFNMKAGYTVDILTNSARYGFEEKISQVEIKVNKTTLGYTDTYGSFSYTHPGGFEDLIEIELIPPKGYLPKSFKTDYVVGGDLKLTKTFSSESIDRLKLAILDTSLAGRFEKRGDKIGQIDQKITNALKTHLFSKEIFQHIDSKTISHSALKTFSKDGWQTTQPMDLIIKPTLILNEPYELEFSVLTSTGSVIAAAKQKLVNPNDVNAISTAVQELAEKLVSNLPFEATIVAGAEANYTINIGTSSGINLKQGDRFQVHGIQRTKLGSTQKTNEVATLQVEKVLENTSLTKIIELKPRAQVSIGDRLSLIRSGNKLSNNLEIKVSDISNNQSIAQANLYENGKWLGATGSDGIAHVNRDNLGSSGVLQIVKQSYRDFSREINFEKASKLDIKLKQEIAQVKIESSPSSAKVYLDSKFIGTTPIAKAVEVASGFAKLKLQGPPGYKHFEQVIEFREGEFNLTGEAKIILESDLISQAEEKIEQKQIDQALTLLSQIPETHSDYLIGLHRKGELLLSVLKKPAQAAATFQKLTNIPKVKEFHDKRFLGSHINEAIAVFLAGEELENKGEIAASVAHYQKSAQILERLETKLRYLKDDNYPQAIHSLHYYRALSYQRIWQNTADEASLRQANRLWENYLSTFSQAPKPSVTAYLENAKIFARQAQAELGSLQITTARR